MAVDVISCPADLQRRAGPTGGGGTKPTGVRQRQAIGCPDFIDRVYLYIEHARGPGLTSASPEDSKVKQETTRTSSGR